MVLGRLTVAAEEIADRVDQARVVVDPRRDRHASPTAARLQPRVCSQQRVHQRDAPSLQLSLDAGGGLARPKPGDQVAAAIRSLATLGWLEIVPSPEMLADEFTIAKGGQTAGYPQP